MPNMVSSTIGEAMGRIPRHQNLGAFPGKLPAKGMNTWDDRLSTGTEVPMYLSRPKSGCQFAYEGPPSESYCVNRFSPICQWIQPGNFHLPLLLPNPY